MPNWLKKSFGRKEEGGGAPVSRQESPQVANIPSSSSAAAAAAGPSSSSSRPPQRTSTSSGAPGAPRPTFGTYPSSYVPLPRGYSSRVSSHDIAMAAVTLGVQPPPQPPTRPDIQQQQVDADLAMAYSIAQQEQHRQHFTNPHAPPPPQQQQQQQQQQPMAMAMPQHSPFGEAVSLPPPAAGDRPDLAMAAALAESQFSARQVDEYKRTTEEVYQAAVDKAMEASMKTVTYDDLLRDIKLWCIDLGAITDDVMSALNSVVRKRNEVAVKLEAALESEDERRVYKLSWMAEHLPAVEDKLRKLGERMSFVGVAVLELQDLRDVVVSTSPPVQQAERQRDTIIHKLFKAIEELGLSQLLPRNNGKSSTATVR